MTRSVPLLTLLTVSLVAFLAWGTTDPPAPLASMPWAVEVYREYCPELVDEGHIEDCWTGYDEEEELHIVVVTDMPTLVPAEMDMIPILTAAPPSTPPAPLAALPRAVEVYRASCPAFLAEVYVVDCWTGYVDEELHIAVVTDSPALVPAEVDSIPTITMPPPAPPTEDGSDNPESSSPPPSTEPQNPSIAGIPYATAIEILRRQNFMAVAGVISVGLDANGIVVTTNQPALVPSTFEGLPVRTEAPVPSNGGITGKTGTAYH